jgi:hypothetical protein
MGVYMPENCEIMTCRKLVSSNSKMGPEKGRLMIMSQASIANFTYSFA